MKTKLALVALMMVVLLGGVNAICMPTAVFGTVKDTCTGEAVSGVKVKVDTHKDWTDSHGWYMLTAYGSGWTQLEASKSGYDTYYEKIKLYCGIPLWKNIEITPTGGCESEPYCGDGVCNAEEDCETCSEDCGECEPEPTLAVKKKGAPKYIWLYSLPRWYDELINGYWKQYSDLCGIEYSSQTFPQNIRWMCKLHQTRGE